MNLILRFLSKLRLCFRDTERIMPIYGAELHHKDKLSLTIPEVALQLFLARIVMIVVYQIFTLILYIEREKVVLLLNSLAKNAYEACVLVETTNAQFDKPIKNAVAGTLLKRKTFAM
jgi:hypothetical protein